MSKKVVRIDSLEPRVLYAATPAAPRADSLGAVFDKTERSDLLARLTNLPAGTRNTLATNLAQNKIGAFDTNLLGYMVNRTTAQFFFRTNQTAGLSTYVKNNFGTSGTTPRAVAVTDNRLFPEQSSVDSFTVSLPANVTWSGLGVSTNPEFIHALNRQEWWVNLAQSYRLTGDVKYANELKYELADWSAENQTAAAPAAWVAEDQKAWYFDSALRVDSWLWAYSTMLGSSAWTGADNSLALYKLAQQADFLYANAATNSDLGSNRTISLGRTTLELGELFPEFDNAAAWETTGRGLVFRAMGTQLYADGSHIEQSPGYTIGVVDDLTEIRQLDTLNGYTWPNTFDMGNGKTIAPKTLLVNAVDGIWQTLSPDGFRPAIGDTYRRYSTGTFLKAELVTGETKWPQASAEARDAWLFGQTVIAPHVGTADPTNLGNRGNTYALPDSGNYILRSGNDANARQINFDAGPKGGIHGHFDLMSFELSGYGKPLIADAGLYKYDASANRAWALSLKAHNTIGVSDLNPGELEGLANPSIETTGITSVAGGYMISASHQGYMAIKGAPVVGRSMWYDGNGLMVIVDFAEATTARNFETGFLLPGTNTGRDLANGLIYSKNASGNVRIQTLLRAGQTAGFSTSGVFTSDSPSNPADPATRFYVQANGTTYTAIATVVSTNAGSGPGAAPNVSWVTAPTKPGQSAVLSVNGTNITFAAPQFDRTGVNGATRGTFNDIAYDSSGRLHSVFQNRDTNTLRYAVRDTNGVWSTVQTIDAGAFAGLYPSLDIDSTGRPGVAYFDGSNGDLKYAYLSNDYNAWQVQTLDSAGSTGLYPSLKFSRNNGAVIAYYNRTKGDLRLATAQTGGFAITTLDSAGDVGRFASLQLDPNRPDASKYALVYEDTSHAAYKYAIQYQTGWRYETVDATMTIAGGYTSLAFYDSGTTSDRYKPAATYYDATNTALKFAYKTGGIEQSTWSNTTVADKKVQGLYTQLAFDGAKPRIFYFDRTNNQGVLASSTGIGKAWAFGSLGIGGREIHVTTYNGTYSYSSLDETTGLMKVFNL